MDDDKKQQNSPEAAKQPKVEAVARNIVKRRNGRIEEINRELSEYNHAADTSEEVDRIQIQREAQYQTKVAELESGLGKKLGNESAEMIHANLVDSVIEQAQKENEKFDSLSAEKKRLVLFNNLELGENAEEVIAKARKLIESKDSDGSKMKVFEEALDYYSRPQEILADTPIYHSTGSYGLAKILEHGALESKKNIATGEQAATGEEIDTTSFVIGGYKQSETVSYFYARKNERQSRLALDKKDIMGIGCEEDIVESVFAELPGLGEAERTQVETALKKMKGNREISDTELMSEKMKDLQDRKYVFNAEEERKVLAALKERLQGASEDQRWNLNKKIAKLEERMKIYNGEAPEMQQEMSDPFPAILIYEGKYLPVEDLTTLTSGLVSERRTKQPIENGLLKQIQTPLGEINKVKEWLRTRIDSLPPDSPERRVLEDVKIVPLEYFEARSIIKGIE